MVRKTVMAWLLDSDPSIRWQVLRDLAKAEETVVQTERDKVAESGWGAELLSQQTDHGDWSGDDPGLLRTIHCLILLKDLGVNPKTEKVKAMADKVTGLKWAYHGSQPFWDGEVEPCINGKVLAAGSYFGIRCERVLEKLLSEQLEDGGWNCEAPASSRSSFHTTIAVLEGLSEYEKAFGRNGDCAAARVKAEEYFLERKLFRRLSTGEVIDKAWLRFHFPPTWHYDVLRGLEYMRSSGRRPEARMAEAIEIVKVRRHQNERWPLVKPYPDDLLKFPMENNIGAASGWNTMRALRVLEWYDA